ncbi:hypothetical protein ACWEVP_47995 [Amycolatopsis sp. NPDC003865]
MPLKRNLSGGEWWKLHARDYPNSRSLDDLKPAFARSVRQFVDALRLGGASVSVSSTLRHPARAYLMHYSWKVAHGMIEAARVPRRGDVPIDWDHGDERVSRAAAMEMVQLANIVHIASLTSNHTRGTAIDMTIGWKGVLLLRIPGTARLWEIATAPRTGSGNAELHTVGADFFAVRKLKTDPPHWSLDGR